MDNVITWNVTNWITVVLMVLVGFLVIAAIAQLFRAGMSGGSAQQTE